MWICNGVSVSLNHSKYVLDDYINLPLIRFRWVPFFFFVLRIRFLVRISIIIMFDGETTLDQIAKKERDCLYFCISLISLFLSLCWHTILFTHLHTRIMNVWRVQRWIHNRTQCKWHLFAGEYFSCDEYHIFSLSFFRSFVLSFFDFHHIVLTKD